MDIESVIMRKLTKVQPRSDLSVIRLRQASYFRLSTRDKLEYVRARTLAMKQPFLDLLGIPEFHPVNYISTRPFYTYGMVTSATGRKLGPECYIQNTEDKSNTLVRLNLEDTNGYSLFNGQFIAVRGRSVQGNELLVDKIYCLPVVNANSARRGHFSAAMARGPFSPAAVEKLVSSGPTAVILLGPFTALERGQEYFQDYDVFVSRIEELLKNSMHVKVVLVPSLDDPSFLKVFPQPAHRESSARLQIVSNPALFYVNEHLVSVINADVIKSLKNNELYEASRESGNLPDSEDASQRASYHLAFQHSFMPVFPADFPVAYGQWLDTEVAPDLLITSSSLGWFQHAAGPSVVLCMEDSPGRYYSIASSDAAEKYTAVPGAL